MTTSVLPISSLYRNITTKHRYYVIGLILMFFLVLSGLVLNGMGDQLISAIYILLLWAVCSSPLLFTRMYRGPVSIALIFMIFYFASFALEDIITLLSPSNKVSPYSTEVELTSDFMVLVGALFFLFGYGIVALHRQRTDNPRTLREWQPGVTTVLGILLWILGYIVTAYYQFGVADRASGMSIDPRWGGFLTLMRYFQPLGSLLLIYRFIVTSNNKILALLLLTFALDFALGYFGDSKEIAIRGPLLLIVCMFLLTDRVPKFTLVVVFLITGIGFNMFSNYRHALGITGKSRIEMLTDGGNPGVTRALPSSQRNPELSERLEKGLNYFSSRIGLKYAANIIHARSNGEFLHGKTIEPLLYAFFPRFILPDKPDNAMIGLLFNDTFHLASKGTFISMGQLTELYWNFGWIGVVTGMAIMGVFFGWLAAVFRMDNYITLPRFLFLLATVYILVLRFETGISLAYTIWARVMLLLILLHLIMPKAPFARQNT